MTAENGPDDDEAERSELRAVALRLKAAIEAAGGNARVAEKAGVPLRTLNSYLAAAADPKVTKLARLAEACGTTVDVLLGIKRHGGGAESGMIPLGRDDELPPGYIALPKLEIRASAGGGRAVVPSDFSGSVVAFREGWLRSLGIAPDNAEFVVAQGDSMEPTIADGDLMLVDRGYGDVVDGKIYVLVVNGLVLVKRLQLLAIGGLLLISDNDRYPTQTISRAEVEQVQIEARVAWFGRAI